MIKSNVKNLIEEVFKNRFNKEKYFDFIHKLFNKECEDVKSFGDLSNKIDFIEYISDRKLYILDSKKIICLCIKLKNEKTKIRARTKQRNFIAEILKKGYEGALVAFYDESSDWRFSFITKSYELNDKIEEKFSSAKRQSFLVGENEPNNTCQRSLLKIFEKQYQGKNIDFGDIENIFSIENISKEFFNKYKELYLKLVESLNKLVLNDETIKKEFEKNNIEVSEFCKKTMGQIVFLYFLQKKGWLGVRENQNFGEGDKNFVKKLFDKKYLEYDNFFDDILEFLFYDALSIDRRQNKNYYDKFKLKIPFLNGGLFEPYQNYDWRKTHIKIDNNIFKDIIETFDEFNFTIKEDEPLEREVAVDPEMLGKVFENLLEVKDRKSKGAFYTPREIVNYMCEESLINYLNTNLEDFSKEEIRELVLKNKFEDDFKDKIKQKFREIDEKISQIKVVDPAVGSGAFPIGMLNEIIKVRDKLTKYYNEDEKIRRTNYILKKEIIENCLYGVDIEKSAVEICKLRFWLSLIVDEEDFQNIEPLPNLDHKIMCGNSLLEEFEGVKLFDERLLNENFNFEEKNKIKIEKLENEIRKLENSNKEYRIEIDKQKKNLKEINKKKLEIERLKNGIEKNTFSNRTLTNFNKNVAKEKLEKLKQKTKQLFNENRHKEKKDLIEEIENLEWSFIEAKLKEENKEIVWNNLEKLKENKSKPFFLWKLYFYDVFKEKGGFDVVIGNPPYGQNKLSKEDSKTLENNLFSLGKKNLGGTQNLAPIFTEFSYYLLNINGVLSFIINNSVCRVDEFKKFREFVLNKTKLKEIVDCGNPFDNVTLEMIILFLTNKKEENYLIKSNSFRKNQINFIENKKWEKLNRFILYYDKFFEKIMNKSEINVLSSVRGGDIEFSKKKIENSYEFLQSGKCIKKYYFDKKYFAYISKKTILSQSFKDNLNFEGLICTRILDKYRVMKKNKNIIVGNNIAKIFFNEKIYDKFFLIGFLNSNFMDYFLKKYIINYSDLTTSFYNSITNPTPIPKISEEEQKPFIEIVEKILDLTQREDYLENLENQKKVKEYEEEINKMVYELYDLTDEEIKIIEENL